jgi:hypothetical protein
LMPATRGCYGVNWLFLARPHGWRAAKLLIRQADLKLVSRDAAKNTLQMP